MKDFVKFTGDSDFYDNASDSLLSHIVATAADAFGVSQDRMVDFLIGGATLSGATYMNKKTSFKAAEGNPDQKPKTAAGKVGEMLANKSPFKKEAREEEPSDGSSSQQNNKTGNTKQDNSTQHDDPLIIKMKRL